MQQMQQYVQLEGMCLVPEHPIDSLTDHADNQTKSIHSRQSLNYPDRQVNSFDVQANSLDIMTEDPYC